MSSVVAWLNVKSRGQATFIQALIDCTGLIIHFVGIRESTFQILDFDALKLLKLHFVGL